ncbi:hypothetical protein CEP51_016335 [Fusarium floridanum]|uniref:Short-chain dehydrogenase/reductase family protein n=2 Tax=Fusarium solani species complex TaxID=232080 RepID=A0A428NS97_9HYPO|nr:hypothetical protein CEP51_016335 [Fusarium floridanum]
MSSDLQSSANWESSTLCTLYKQLWVGAKPLPDNISLAGQTAVITGGNAGLGFEAGRQLLQLGLSNLVIAVRSRSKGEAAASKLREEFPLSTITVSIVDLTDYDSITNFCRECEKLERLDYVILNAGLMASELRRAERTGHELVFQTNYLSTVFMVLLLVPTLISKSKTNKSDHPPVLSIVGSDTMYSSTFTASTSVFDTIDNPPSYEELPHYATTKLLLMMFISRLAKEVDSENIIINVCNPGLTNGTGLVHHNEDQGLLNRVGSMLLRGLGRPIHVGASNYTYALLAAGLESHGSFVSDWSIKPYAPIMYTTDGQKISDMLWEETLRELTASGPVSLWFKPSFSLL